MRAPATQILSFTIILMYGLMLMASDAPLSSLFLFSPELLQEHGAADPRLIWQGETWRLFTAVFLHGGFLHLFFNVFVLRQIGPLLEPTLGSSRFLLLFLATGIGSFGFSLYINGQLAVGASGGIFGLIGGLLMLSFFTREQVIAKRLFWELIILIGLNLLLGWALPIVDNAAHLGGLAIGIVLGAGLLSDRRFVFFTESEQEDGNKEPQAEIRTLGNERISSWGTGLGLALCVLLLVIGLKPTNRLHHHITLAHEAIDYGNQERFDFHLNMAQMADPSHPSVALLEARALLHQQKVKRAKPLLSYAIKNLSDNPKDSWLLAMRQIAPTANMDRQLFYDAPLSNALCDEVLGLTLVDPDLDLLNNCAWFMLTTKNKMFHKPKRAIQLARFAVERSGENVPPAVLHTLAEAEAQTGRPQEAMIMMQKLLLQKTLRQRSYYEAEYRRFLAISEQQP